MCVFACKQRWATSFLISAVAAPRRLIFSGVWEAKVAPHYGESCRTCHDHDNSKSQFSLCGHGKRNGSWWTWHASRSVIVIKDSGFWRRIQTRSEAQSNSNNKRIIHRGLVLSDGEFCFCLVWRILKLCRQTVTTATVVLVEWMKKNSEEVYPRWSLNDHDLYSSAE